VLMLDCSHWDKWGCFYSVFIAAINNKNCPHTRPPQNLPDC
jgi:hypothetical protein